MKKQKTVLSERQREGMVRNYGSMSVKSQRKYAPVIIMMAVTVRIIKGKLGVDLRTNDGTFLFTAKTIFDALTANTAGYYSPAFAGLATLGTQVTAFETAIEAFMKGGLGTEAAKRDAKAALKITLQAALGYVNNIAFLDQPNASAIILGAKMQLVKAGSLNKQDFSVRQGEATGEIKLSSIAGKFDGKRVTTIYYWEYSTDNGVTWVPLDSTSVSKTTAAGMTVNVRTLFRKRIQTVKGGITAWCDPVAITPV